MRRSSVGAMSLAVVLVCAAGAATAVGASPRAPSGGIARGTIGSAPPSLGAAARIRALGLDDGSEAGPDDGGGILGRGLAVPGTIDGAPPRSGASARIRGLGVED
jgi:hypothetical protein